VRVREGDFVRSVGDRSETHVHQTIRPVVS